MIPKQQNHRMHIQSQLAAHNVIWYTFQGRREEIAQRCECDSKQENDELRSFAKLLKPSGICL